MMPDIGSDATRFDKFFTVTEVAEVAQVVPDQPPVVEAAPAAPAATAPPEPPKEPEPAKQIGLADKIRADREAKAASAKREDEARTYRERAEAAEARLATLTKSDVVADTIGWAEAMGLNREEQAVVGETLLYGLVPDRATPEVRIKLLEARQARQRKLDEESAKANQERASQEQIQRVHTNYIEALASSVESLPPGTLPDSEAWFSGDHEAYVRSLYATANNLADAARAQGRAADLSFGAVAKVLEADIASRAQRLRSRGATPEKPVEQPPAGKQPEVPVIVTSRGLNGGGTPRPPATTEAERLKRASEIVFRTK